MDPEETPGQARSQTITEVAGSVLKVALVLAFIAYCVYLAYGGR